MWGTSDSIKLSTWDYVIGPQENYTVDNFVDRIVTNVTLGHEDFTVIQSKYV